MNYRHMPELPLRWTYPLALALMIVSTVGMWFFLRKKRWF
jgi:Mg2+ and Co2+ transporter CorA